MEELFTFQNIVTLVFLITYVAIFFVQKSQLKKQSSIVEKYSKIFEIINIDEIQKYVELKQESTELAYTNKITKLSSLGESYDELGLRITETLNSSKSNLDKSEEIHKNLISVLNRNQELVKNLFKLNVEEYKEIHNTLNEKITGIKDKKLIPKIETALLKIVKKYEKLKIDEMDKIDFTLRSKNRHK
jgi:hypothetical protein